MLPDFSVDTARSTRHASRVHKQLPAKYESSSVTPPPPDTEDVHRKIVIRNVIIAIVAFVAFAPIWDRRHRTFVWLASPLDGAAGSVYVTESRWWGFQKDTKEIEFRLPTGATDELERDWCYRDESGRWIPAFSWDEPPAE